MLKKTILPLFLLTSACFVPSYTMERHSSLADGSRVITISDLMTQAKKADFEELQRICRDAGVPFNRQSSLITTRVYIIKQLTEQSRRSHGETILRAQRLQEEWKPFDGIGRRLVEEGPEKEEKKGLNFSGQIADLKEQVKKLQSAATEDKQTIDELTEQTDALMDEVVNLSTANEQLHATLRTTLDHADIIETDRQKLIEINKEDREELVLLEQNLRDIRKELE